MTHDFGMAEISSIGHTHTNTSINHKERRINWTYLNKELFKIKDTIRIVQKISHRLRETTCNTYI